MDNKTKGILKCFILIECQQIKFLNKGPQELNIKM